MRLGRLPVAEHPLIGVSHPVRADRGEKAQVALLVQWGANVVDEDQFKPLTLIAGLVRRQLLVEASGDGLGVEVWRRGRLPRLPAVDGLGLAADHLPDS